MYKDYVIFSSYRFSWTLANVLNLNYHEDCGTIFVIRTTKSIDHCTYKLTQRFESP